MKKVITMEMPEYPELLKKIKAPPEKLFCSGDISLLNSRCAAVVGSRKTTQYGRNTAVEISSRIASHGITVVSGMAMGIDTCAHIGALKAGGGTIAVLGCGTDICYPPENVKLKEQIEDNGLIVSEYPPGTRPERYHFPQRNRIISGLSELTAVIQAGSCSGALITAELAAEQGREVCAVPGNIDSQYNVGNNKLIKEGAYPVTSMGDVAELMGVGGMTEKEVRQRLSETEQQIYHLLKDHGELTMDGLSVLLGKTPGYTASIVTVMEMKGIVFSELGKIFVAKD